MATTGIIDGTLITLKSGGTAYAHATNFEFNDTISTRNITTKDTISGTEYAGQRSDTTISLEGMIAFDAAEGHAEARLDAMGLVAVAFSWGSFVSGDPEFSANAIITNVTFTGNLDDNATYSVEAVVTGSVTVGTTS